MNVNKLLICNLITVLEFVNFSILLRRWICIFKFCIQTIQINRPRLMVLISRLLLYSKSLFTFHKTIYTR